MFKPCSLASLAVISSFGSLRGQEVRLSAFEHQETLYFNRGSIDLSPVGAGKTRQFVQAFGPTGRWVIGIPRNHGASEQVLRGRIRTIVSALMDLGVVGVQTVAIEPVAREGFEPMVIGKLNGDPWAGIDPNDDEPRVVPPPTKVPPPRPVTAPKPEPMPPFTTPPSPAPWLTVSGSLEGQSLQVEKPPTATIDAKPYEIVGLQVNLAPKSMAFELGYSATVQNLFAANQQAEPTTRLDTSSSATHFYGCFRVAVRFEESPVPIQLSFQDETSATTAILPKGTLLIDRQGSAWVSLVDGVDFAYKHRNRSYALDWLFGGSEPAGLGVSLGLHLDRIERPFSVLESGSYSDGIIYAANHDSTGIHASLRQSPWQEGLHFGAFELRLGHSSGIHLVDRYELLKMDVSKVPFNDFKAAFTPYYLHYLGSQGFVRISLPLEYTKSTFKNLVVNSNGDGQLGGLYGTTQRYGIKVDLGLRY